MGETNGITGLTESIPTTATKSMATASSTNTENDVTAPPLIAVAGALDIIPTTPKPTWLTQEIKRSRDQMISLVKKTF